MTESKKDEVTKFEQIIYNCHNFIIKFNNERESQSPPQIDEDLIPKFTRKSIMNSTQQKKYHERSRLIFKNGQIIWTDNPNELISDITINGIGKSIKLVASIEYYTKIICDTMHDFISERYLELYNDHRKRYLFFKIVLKTILKKVIQKSFFPNNHGLNMECTMRGINIFFGLKLDS